jgi:hypothetical protein
MEGTMGNRGSDLSRRQLLPGAAAGVAVATLGPLAAPAHADGGGGGRLVPRHRIGIWLYAVRDLLAADPDPAGTLRQIAAIGYRNIERDTQVHPMLTPRIGWDYPAQPPRLRHRRTLEVNRTDSGRFGY